LRVDVTFHLLPSFFTQHNDRGQPFFLKELIMLDAVRKGDAKELAELMKQDPGFNVNMSLGRYGHTLLHLACLGNHRSPVIPLLLAHPDINVNAKDKYGYPPLNFACDGCPSCIRELLKDFRVNVTEPNSKGRMPLWRAAFYGYLDVMKWWIASGREMDLGKPGDIFKTDAIGAAKRNNKAEVVALLERFKSNPTETRYMIRLELGLVDEVAAEMFALVVFVSDGLLITKATGVKAGAKRTRFFNIARQLPLELQMVLCFRQVGLSKEIILGQESEAAFKELARKLW